MKPSDVQAKTICYLLNFVMILWCLEHHNAPKQNGVKLTTSKPHHANCKQTEEITQVTINANCSFSIIRVNFVNNLSIKVMKYAKRRQVIILTHIVSCKCSTSFSLQDHEWEVVEKPAQSSPQVSRKDDTSSSSQGKPRPDPPSSLPSSPAKKKESSSTSPEGIGEWSRSFFI